METGRVHLETFIASAETTPGKYYVGEDANYDGADVRPTIGGIASGTGEQGKDIPIVDVNRKGEIIYGRIVNNDAVTETPIPREKEYKLGPISDYYLEGQ